MIVGDVGLMECVSGLLTEENLDMLKLYLKVGMVEYGASKFGEDFYEAANVYTQESMGSPVIPRWRRSRPPLFPIICTTMLERRMRKNTAPSR